MNAKAMLAGVMVVLVALAMTASACYVCGTVPTAFWQFAGNKAPGEQVTVSVTQDDDFSYSWLMNKKPITGGSVVSTPLTDNDNSITLTMDPNDCGYEVGIILTMTNKNDASCILAKCVWWTVTCPTCPTLDNFCEGKATQANADKFAIPAYAHWEIDNVAFPASGQTVLQGLNAMSVTTDTPKTAKLFVGTKEVCSSTFTVRDMPEISFTVGTPITPPPVSPFQ